MAKKAPDSAATVTATPAVPAPTASAAITQPVTLSLSDKNKPQAGVLGGLLGNKKTNTEIAGSRFDTILDSEGRIISASDFSAGLFGNQIAGITLGCGGKSEIIKLFLVDSPDGIGSYQNSPSPGDVEKRATIAPDIFQALLNSAMLKTTKQTLAQLDQKNGDAVTLEATASPIEVLCNQPIIQQALKKAESLRQH